MIKLVFVLNMSHIIKNYTEDIPLDIVFEDKDIVVNKASDMVIHPSYGHYTGTLVHALSYK